MADNSIKKQSSENMDEAKSLPAITLFIFLDFGFKAKEREKKKHVKIR